MTISQQVVSRFRKIAGYGYGTGRMSVLFVETKRRPIFNRDTIAAINRETITVVGDDGESHEANLRVLGQQSSGPLTYADEKAGKLRETRVDVEYPMDEEGSAKISERAVLTALAGLGRRLGFKVEPSKAGYRPKTRTK